MKNYNYNFNKKAKETFTVDELEKLREYCCAVQYNYISTVDFLGEELSKKLKKFYDEEQSKSLLD